MTKREEKLGGGRWMTERREESEGRDYLEILLILSTQRRLHDLPLTRRRLPIFAMSHLAHHIIDEQSPIYNMSIADLVFRRAEFFVQIFGTDAGYEQTVHVCGRGEERGSQRARRQA